jgi:membrane fusion protein, copper/silver efflux system
VVLVVTSHRKLVLLLSLTLASFLAGYWFHHPPAVSTAAGGDRRILYYRDPMHPAYKSDKPGIAPDCGMQLEPVYAEGGPVGAATKESAEPVLPPGTVQVSPEKQQIIGVQVGQVERRPGARTVRVLGRVAADESRVYSVKAPIDGWIREASSQSTGNPVKKDEVLASFYSPDFLSAQTAYIYALGSLDRSETTGNETLEQTDLAQASIQGYVDVLRNLGMPDVQIRELARGRHLARKIWLSSPATGFILARNVSVGQRIQKGSELYRIADLSHVWILADTFENEAQYFRPGASVRVVLPYQNRTLPARVSDALPQFDPVTRALKVRLEADNPQYTLRPDMFVDVELPVSLPPAIVIPVDAVLDSGLKKTVFVDRGNGYFEPRAVETGGRYENRVEIIKGLEPGERIVISGNFLIDSESRMKLAAAGLYGTLTKDPVCGMELAESKARASGWMAEYRGKTYYFCSQRCMQKFDNLPSAYVGKTGR